MGELFKMLETLPGWLITSVIVIFTSVLNYVAFRTGVGKDIMFHTKEIKQNANNIGELFKKTDELERSKADEIQITAWRAEVRTDFQGFKDDIRENMREFKEDIRIDINNVLIAIKRNNGCK